VTCAPGETNSRETRPLARGNTASAEADAPLVPPVPEELDTEAVVPPLLEDELGSEISPEAFASTTLPRPPTVTTNVAATRPDCLHRRSCRSGALVPPDDDADDQRDCDQESQEPLTPAATELPKYR
jgi:hypothetical protein